MYGRGDEWAAVLGLLRSVTDATVNVLLVEGGPGIGKTLLLDEAAGAAAARGTAVASGRSGRARPAPSGPPLWALREDPASPVVAESTCAGWPGPMLWPAERVRLSLERRSAAGPLLVTLDDLQWADPATLMVLRTLPSWLADRPVAWLLARRGTSARGDAGLLFDLLEEEGAGRVVLRPLDGDAVAELAADALTGTPEGELAELVAQAGGDPLLLLALLTGLREEGSVVVEAGAARLAGTAVAGVTLPWRVHTAVRRRLDELGTGTRHVLEAAAALGRSFSPAYAAETLGEPPAALLPSLEEALSAGVLDATSDGLIFRHELLWRSIVEQVPVPARTAPRERVARRPPGRAGPRSRRGPAGGGATPESLTNLALLVWDEGRLSRGLDLVREAVRLPPDGLPRQPRAVLATMLTDLRLLDEAETTIASTVEEAAGEPVWAAEIPVLLARLDLASGRLGSAIERAETGLTAAEILGAPALASAAVSVLGTASLRAGDLPGALRYLEHDPVRSAWSAPPYMRLCSELTAGRIDEARGGAACGMISLSVVYDALPRHTGALTGEPTAAAWLVRVAMAVDDRRRADAVVDAAEGIAWRNPGLPGPAVAAVHARALREHDPEALFRVIGEHTDPWAKGSAAEDLGVLLGADPGCREQVIENLDTALTCYGAAGAARDTARVRGRLRRLGERRRHWVRTEHPVSGWASLTGTEQAVCRLVAQGLTNRQAAGQMFISEHTVAFHLRQVFRKLGIRSRVELAGLAVRAGAGQDARHR